jgi:hypothetical protein
MTVLSLSVVGSASKKAQRMAKRTYRVRGRSVALKDTAKLGEGGEADVFDISAEFPPEELALKRWKEPDHPDYQGDDDEAKRNRALAELRLETYGKKLQVFPKGLPNRIIAPLDLVTDVSGKVFGYTMPKLKDVTKVAFLADRGRRESLNVSAEAIVRLFRDLHPTVQGAHANVSQVVFGDFNYSNVLANLQTLQAFVIDADTFQFTSPEAGFFSCRAFTPRFVDPLICDPLERKLVQKRPHTQDTDWYAFALQLFECLMFTAIYGGTHLPKDRRTMLSHDLRPLKRISVFHPEVKYPNNGTPLTWLPRKVAGYYEDLIAKDARGEFPYEFLDILLAQAQGKSVDVPLLSAPAGRKELVRGKLRFRRVFNNPGSILDAALRGKSVDVVTHNAGAFEREDRSIVTRAAERSDLTVRVSGDRTVFASQGRIVVLAPGKQPSVYAADTFQGGPLVFDTCGTKLVWCNRGKLMREGRDGPEDIGTVMEGQTLVWTGPSFGFGFYRAGGYRVGFVFSPERSGINDSVQLPPLRGELVDSWCTFTAERCWFFAATRLGGKVTHTCVAINSQGEVVAQATAEEGDASWLGTLRGKCAATLSSSKHVLFAAKDDGLVIVGPEGAALIEQASFDGTAELVSPDDRLLYDRSEGLYVVNRRGIHLLTFAG